MARDGGAIWLDLADAEGRAVRIDKDGWGLVSAGQVTPKFFRPANMRPLPEPLPGEADASLLRRLLNLSDENTFQLLLTWLAFAIVPDKPYPIIAVSGPAGAAKSSFAEFVRATIDPSEVPLFGMPKRDDGTARTAIGVKRRPFSTDYLWQVVPRGFAITRPHLPREHRALS
jgi:hypothetical protein